MASEEAEPNFNQLVSTFLQHATPGPNANPARLKDDFCALEDAILENAVAHRPLAVPPSSQFAEVIHVLEQDTRCPDLRVKRIQAAYDHTVKRIREQNETNPDNEVWSSGGEEEETVERQIKPEGNIRGGTEGAVAEQGDLVHGSDFDLCESDKTFDTEMHVLMPTKCSFRFCNTKPVSCYMRKRLAVLFTNPDTERVRAALGRFRAKCIPCRINRQTCSHATKLGLRGQETATEVVESNAPTPQKTRPTVAPKRKAKAALKQPDEEATSRNVRQRLSAAPPALPVLGTIYHPITNRPLEPQPIRIGDVYYQHPGSSVPPPALTTRSASRTSYASMPPQSTAPSPSIPGTPAGAPWVNKDEHNVEEHPAMRLLNDVKLRMLAQDQRRAALERGLARTREFFKELGEQFVTMSEEDSKLLKKIDEIENAIVAGMEE